ncbi:FmdE family protein [Clostridiisalibacter paucivorans]|uniref:FmdE family protein n=1 Tax=Clostridiisalibacter paucivorans TaxID=408753 RepID=UPI0004790CB7|nr:FmdE family protein [Clostridiisalibacter paucivorans]
MNNKLWNECARFHGHKCPGLAIGFKACELAIEKLNIRFSNDEEIVCVVENDACGVDAVQYITGCTFGKGNLLFKDRGKQAFSFFNRDNDDSIRLVFKGIEYDGNKEGKQNFILNTPATKLFEIKKPEFNVPQRAKIFKSIVCESCGELAAESRIRIQDGKKVCLDCYEHYDRGGNINF